MSAEVVKPDCYVYCGQWRARQLQVVSTALVDKLIFGNIPPILEVTNRTDGLSRSKLSMRGRVNIAPCAPPPLGRTRIKVDGGNVGQVA